MRRTPDLHRRHGQSATEAILMLPVALLFVFSVLQLGQLATALLVANYAAGAIARQMVQDNATAPTSSMDSRFDELLTAGMKRPQLEAVPDGGGILRNVEVHACAQVDAL